MEGTAVISPCETYRYALTRRWSPGGTRVLFVLLNPSTADANDPDPTMTRCVGFAQREGGSILEIVNTYALRSKNPKALWSHSDPVGPDNDDHIHAALQRADLVVAGWGGKARADRGASVADLLRAHPRVRCLGLNKNGSPRHPLYLRSDTPLQRFPGEGP